MPVKLRDGVPPFTWLANGTPVLRGVRRREVLLPGLGAGFSTLSVIDARGQSARVLVQIAP